MVQMGAKAMSGTCGKARPCMEIGEKCVEFGSTLTARDPPS